MLWDQIHRDAHGTQNQAHCTQGDPQGNPWQSGDQKLRGLGGPRRQTQLRNHPKQLEQRTGSKGGQHCRAAVIPRLIPWEELAPHV